MAPALPGRVVLVEKLPTGEPREAVEDPAASQLGSLESLLALPARPALVRQLREERQHNRSVDAIVSLELDRSTRAAPLPSRSDVDELLAQVAARLRRAARPGDAVVRNGDGFMVLCRALPDPDAARVLAERLRASASGTFSSSDGGVSVSASAGISLMRSDRDPEATMEEAEIALHLAKQHGNGRVGVFEERFSDPFVRSLSLEGALRAAVEAGQLELFYQPVVSLEDLALHAAEALLRWPQPEGNLISAGDIVTLAESSGLIVTIGSWVLGSACGQARTWIDEGAFEAAAISVNLSPLQLSEPRLVESVRSALASSALDPSRLILEITESAVVADPEPAIDVLERLKDLGIRLAIDDFGTGYSSLSHLKRFPVDIVKIDRSFVAGLGSDPDDSVIVGAIVHLANALGLETIAEGVETEQQAEELRRLGCRLAQGYLFGPPKPASSFARSERYRRPAAQ
jgi:predicted signal transduction protein with EAL and GGDEF domain